MSGKYGTTVAFFLSYLVFSVFCPLLIHKVVWAGLHTTLIFSLSTISTAHEVRRLLISGHIHLFFSHPPSVPQQRHLRESYVSAFTLHVSLSPLYSFDFTTLPCAAPGLFSTLRTLN